VKTSKAARAHSARPYGAQPSEDTTMHDDLPAFRETSAPCQTLQQYPRTAEMELMWRRPHFRLETRFSVNHRSAIDDTWHRLIHHKAKVIRSRMEGLMHDAAIRRLACGMFFERNHKRVLYAEHRVGVEVGIAFDE
jgi:hypothetical protein